MIQDGQLVKFVNGGDAARIQKVQIAVGRDATRAPRVQHSERGMPVQVVTGEDPTRAPFIHPFEGLAPAAWFRQGVGITVTGSGVSQWDDQSGNGRHLLQGTNSARPALQGDGTILFNGTSHYLKTNAFTLNRPYSIVAVLKAISWTSGDGFWDGDTANRFVLQQLTGSPKVRLADASLGTSTSTGLVVGETKVVFASQSGTDVILQINNGTPITGSLSGFEMGGFQIGRTGGGAYAHCEYREAAVFNAAHDATTRARIISGLMARHGVA